MLWRKPNGAARGCGPRLMGFNSPPSPQPRVPELAQGTHLECVICRFESYHGDCNRLSFNPDRTATYGVADWRSNRHKRILLNKELPLQEHNLRYSAGACARQ